MSQPVFIDARRTLLGSLIDYAGLFPPASLSLPEAVAAYREARLGPHGWMLGTFLAPASRLDELAGLLVRTMMPGERSWEIGVVFDAEPGASASAAAAFTAHMKPAAAVGQVEVKLPPAAADRADSERAVRAARCVFAAAGSVSNSVMPFFEVPAAGGASPADVAAAVEVVARLRSETRQRAGAKLRCGGSGPGDFPEPDLVASFLLSCCDADLPFKATAGLHHPIRHFDAQVGAKRHGFLNLLAAAAVAEAGAGHATVAAVISEEDGAAITVGMSGMSWRGRSIGPELVTRTRSTRFSSYGSCSFDEPVADLTALGVLSAAPA